MKVYNSLWQREIDKQKSNQWFLIFVACLVSVILIITLLFSFVFFNVWVDGVSMKNTLNDGDILVASYVKEPDRGSIVIIEGKMENGKELIKRVIAVSGDKIKMENGKVYLAKNGGEYQVLDEPYANGVTFYKETQHDREWEIGENEYFFLGDNRGNSQDSRYYGTCTREQIVGVVLNSSLATRGMRKAYFNVVFKIGNFFGIRTQVN